MCFKHPLGDCTMKTLPDQSECHCIDLQPLHVFISGVGGTGKSVLIKTLQALLSKLWEDETRSTLCAVTAPTGLAVFNVSGVTIHRLNVLVPFLQAAQRNLSADWQQEDAADRREFSVADMLQKKKKGTSSSGKIPGWSYTKRSKVTIK